jgi:hypothetical protein
MFKGKSMICLFRLSHFLCTEYYFIHFFDSLKVMDLLREAYLSFVQNEGFNYLHGVSIQSDQCPELLVVNIFRFQGRGTNENFTGVKIDTKVEIPYVSAYHET